MFEGNEIPYDRVLTEAELAEINKIRQERGIVGFMLFDGQGQRIGGEKLHHDALAPIFANLMEYADVVAAELGEEGGCGGVYLEGAEFELAGIRLTTCNAVIARKKLAQTAKGFGDGGE